MGESPTAREKRGPLPDDITPAPAEARIRPSIDVDARQLSLRAVSPVNVSTKELTVSISQRPSRLDVVGYAIHRFRSRHQPVPPKVVLRDVTSEFPTGTITAIFGASGSGKTTLLNVLSQRMLSSKIQRSGATLYNGSPKLSSVRSAYVMQQDILLPTLTVRETLRYAAELRLPPPVTAQERGEIVEEVILELGLKDCADTRIGSHEHKGCSGGEKRRTSLAVQLLANPSVLFLDEVTTGLDATSAYDLMMTLRRLAKKGRTIITTIHQPRSEIWELFDRIILLSVGEVVYNGPRAACMDHFKALGHALPPFVNPAEHLIDLAAIDNRSSELEDVSLKRVSALKNAWIQHELDEKDQTMVQNQLTEHEKVAGKRRAGMWRQIHVQTLRTFKTAVRDPSGVAGCLMESIFMGVLAGWIFVNLGSDLSGIRSREGALYTAAALQGYLIMLFETYRLTLDIGVFDRERLDGVVSVPSFLISRRLARLLLEDIPIPLIFSVIFYFMAGFRHVAGEFFVFFAVTLLGQFCSVTFATVCVALSRDFATASLIANINYTIQSMACGFFVQSDQIPPWLNWIKHATYTWYATGALTNNEFIGWTTNPQGQIYDCPFPGGPSNPYCTPYTGIFIVDTLGYPSDRWIWRPIVILAAFAAAFYLGAGLIFQLYKVDMRISRASKSTMDTAFGKESLKAKSAERVRSLDVSLNKVSLVIRQRSLLGKETEIHVLKPITATFAPGILNVIMGVSGGGKTTLLNLLAARLKNSLTTRYEREGDILFGGSIPSEKVAKAVVSYVAQSDDMLLPTLTVRETLYFSARLRLPKWMSNDEKKKRAEEVLRKLGLRDCAENLIGNDFVKGISGGEKRRVSIAIQILTDPRILLLDEPTSGLDSFTASSIIEVLRGLAEEGRTVIVTIHQSRSDLFPLFNHVVLLARGGHMVYSGPGHEMLPYFSQHGHDCPEHINPADFALDLISVNLQSTAKEERTRRTVQSLIQDWSEDDPQLTRQPAQISAPAELGSFERERTPFRLALPILVQRSFTSFKRNPSAILARSSQVIAFGVVVTLFFAPLQSNFESIQSRFGFIQEFLALYFVGMLQNVAVYPFEKVLFYSEHDDRAYSAEAFFVTYTALEVPLEVLASLAFSSLTTFAAGLPWTVTTYFAVAFNAFAIVNCGESVGIMFNTLFASTGFAVNMTSVVLSLSLLMSGVLSTNLANVLWAFNFISPAKWSIGMLAPYTLAGITFTCSDDQKFGGACPISTGQEALDLYNLDTDGARNLAGLAAAVVAYRLAAYLLLKAVLTRWQWPGRRARPKRKAQPRLEERGHGARDAV